MGYNVPDGETELTEQQKKVTSADVIKNKIQYLAGQHDLLKSKEEGLKKELENTRMSGIEVVGAIKGLQELLKEFE